MSAVLPEWILYISLAFAYHWSARSGAFWMIMARLPSTVAHELSHLLIALFFSASPRGFSLWPRRQGDTWQLGSVTCSSLRWWNSFPVAMSPVLINLPLAWWLHGQPGGWYKVAAFVCLAGAIPSWQDLKVSLSSLIGAGVWIAAVVGVASQLNVFA